MTLAHHSDLVQQLWSAADRLRANSKLRSSEYSTPVLGLIFLRYADYKFAMAQQELSQEETTWREIDKNAYQAKDVMYLPERARYDRLLALTESENIGREINEAMKAIEEANEALRDVLPKQYMRLDNDMLISLLRRFNFPVESLEGDVFGQIYEYFLGKFAMAEGQKGGEFFTPTSLVKLIVEIIEPYHGLVYDPACGSGGMFVQSANFVQRRRGTSKKISIYGQDRVLGTVRLAKMNLAVHGLEGKILEGNTYYQDRHRSIGNFDYVMANPPFNVKGVDKGKLEQDRHFPFGLPAVDNANYLWIQHFCSALKNTGRAGFVMANSASDAGHSELAIRKKLIESKAVDVMITIGPKFFYTVALPCTLWFLDKGKIGSTREDKVLFIDARDIFQQVDRAHREFTPVQLEFLANIVRLYREETIVTAKGSAEWIEEVFPDGVYRNVPGRCYVASIDEIAGQAYSLNPGRYVGVAIRDEDDFDFQLRLGQLHEELELLNAEGHELENQIAHNLAQLI